MTFSDRPSRASSTACAWAQLMGSEASPRARRERLDDGSAGGVAGRRHVRAHHGGGASDATCYSTRRARWLRHTATRVVSRRLVAARRGADDQSRSLKRRRLERPPPRPRLRVDPRRRQPMQSRPIPRGTCPPVPVPRHREIPLGTARAICRQLAVPPPACSRCTGQTRAYPAPCGSVGPLFANCSHSSRAVT